jgi:hypothetical protein
MAKHLSRNILFFFTIAFILSTNACSGSRSKYLQLSDGIAIVSFSGILPKEIETPSQEVVQILQNEQEAFHILDLSGMYAYSAVQYFVPIADRVTELRVDIAGNVAEHFSTLPEYKNLKTLCLDDYEMIGISSEVEELLEILRSCQSLENLIIKQRGTGVYHFSQGLKADSLVQTINGVTLNEWNPWDELVHDEDKYYYTVSYLADTFESYFASYTTSTDRPSQIKGKILIANVIESGSLLFHDYYPDTNAFAKKNIATSLDECAAVIMIHAEYSFVGSYTDGSKAYDSTYSIEVFDTNNQIRYLPFEFISIKAPEKKDWDYSTDEDKAHHPRYDGGELLRFLETIISTDGE